ncbi:hypothetical protein JG687_00014687 [Phytophthora cactorum]|uniref:Uncharacterized protein n=1 Tax=Phytophthora cactorum TaxID=29920 RepID=A0A8T1TVV4_9STRA|nr:hypothetical protein JG687_00014687 [Phytophthora cactorum]
MQMSEPIQDNPTLQRTIKRLSDTVIKFSRYLQRYNEMNRVVRIFKSASMNKQQQKFMDGVDKLFRIFNFAANVATMSGQAAVSVNAARLPANLEDVHGDTRLTHDEIHAALVEEKQQNEMDTIKMPAEREPFLGNYIADRVRIIPPLHEVEMSPVVADVKQNSAAYVMEENATVDDEPGIIMGGEEQVELSKSTGTDHVEDARDDTNRLNI